MTVGSTDGMYRGSYIMLTVQYPLCTFGTVSVEAASCDSSGLGILSNLSGYPD